MDEQNRNRNVWAQLTQGNYAPPPQGQSYVLEGFTPAQGYASIPGYAPEGAHDGHSDYEGSTSSHHGTPQSQGLDTNTSENDDIPEEEDRNFVSSQREKRKLKTQAQPKEEQPKSRRAQLRQKIVSEHGEVASNDSQKGLVEWRDGVFQWWDPEYKAWLNAAYHSNFRDQFIVEDALEGTYKFSPASGSGNDVTSVCSAFNQLEWNLADRDSWDNVVDNDGNQILYLIERPDQTYDEPERLWWHEGFVLLDGDNKPVRPWSGIPRCFSSKIEGGRMEALKRILPMTIQDFRARMPRAVPTDDTGTRTKSLSLPSTFGHRISRFRAVYQVPSWIERAASSVLKKQVTDQLRMLGENAERATSTKGLQTISRFEIERRKSSTRGRYLYKASGRALPEDERKRRDQKYEEKMKRLAASQPRALQRPASMPVTPWQSSSPTSQPADLQRPASMPVTPWQSASPTPYIATHPFSAGNKRRREDDDFDDFDVGQSEPVPKRGRLGSSPLGPLSQDCTQTVPDDSNREAPNTYDTSGPVSTIYPYQGQSESNASGLGLNFGEEDRLNPTPSQQSQATLIEGNASIHHTQNDMFQIDYRFVDPQNPLEQLRIQAALFYPRAHYFSLVGEHPPHTSEGSYSDQYYQISALLAQNWMVAGGPPSLADVGPWLGGFDMVPSPDLPDEVAWAILHPVTGSSPVQTAVDVDTGSQGDGQYTDSSDGLFEEYFEGTEDAEGDEE